MDTFDFKFAKEFDAEIIFTLPAAASLVKTGSRGGTLS